MRLEYKRNYGLGMHALVPVCSWNTNGIMVWACYRMLLEHEQIGHGCTGYHMLLKHERTCGLGKDALVTVYSWNTNGIMLGAWMLSSSHSVEHEHEQNYCLGSDALVTVCTCKTNVVMVWAWMHWLQYAFGRRSLLWFVHGGTGYRMLLKHERNSHRTSRKPP